MEFIMDMVHHNPGELPFDTMFSDPEKLKSYGYNAQVFKHINTAVSFADYDSSVFDASPNALSWINALAEKISAEIASAKNAGLNVYYHTDLFVLPKAVAEKYADEIYDADGKIDLRRERTLDLHRALFNEIFTKFPDVDGLIIRVGETYLHDTPYHTGNGAVHYGCKDRERDDFVFLLNFLREEICEKYDKYLFFRTWDCFPDRFHASADYYLDVTNRVKPHNKLIFSIKHTALDFWRRVKFNDCLTIGGHRQIIEVQCQREYEGKGAYPMYVMNGVINAFSENRHPKGLKDIVNDEKICGIYTWTRGGGWFGPYPKNEFWCDLNAYVISQFANNPQKSEEEIFHNYAKKVMGLSCRDATKFRQMCLISQEAVLKGRYIEYYDRISDESIMPCENWMRDDRLGGLRQLEPAFSYLYSHSLLDAAVCEKLQSLLLWRKAEETYKDIRFTDDNCAAFIGTSVQYAVKLFGVIYHGWAVMAEGYNGDMKKIYNLPELSRKIAEFDKAWADYQTLADDPNASTLYKDEYLNAPGLRESIEHYRAML